MPMAASDPIDIYVAECQAQGKTPSVRRVVNWMFLYVSEDPERAWNRLAPHLLHVSNSYARWMTEAGTTQVYQPATDVNALKGTGTFEVVTPDEAITLVANADNVIVDPLFGGCPPELAEDHVFLASSWRAAADMTSSGGSSPVQSRKAWAAWWMSMPRPLAAIVSPLPLSIWRL